MSTHSARAEAARAVLAVQSGKSLDDALARLPAALTARDAAFTKALAYGVLRDLSLLHWIITQLLDKPYPPSKTAQALLAVGLYQLRSLHTPAHAAVGETVQAADALGEPKLRGLLNALLRRYQREAAAIEERLPSVFATRYSVPEWLVQAIHRDWGENGEAVLDIGNTPGPLALRVNARRTTREDYLRTLATAGIEAAPLPGLPQGIVLAEARPVHELPGFAEGLVSVQDGSAQLAADLLELRSGQRVLDACAAPGGKSAHILERADVQLTSLDIDAKRLARVQDNFKRLGLSGVGFQADAARPAGWWRGEMFDRILLDAPCSGTGVIRRHPDIKWLRRADDIPRLAALQGQLLDALWPLLAPGGLLVYATCSILRAEGEEVTRDFLVRTADAHEKKIEPPSSAHWGEARSAGRRLAPGEANPFDGDGFYYAKLIKRAVA